MKRGQVGRVAMKEKEHKIQVSNVAEKKNREANMCLVWLRKKKREKNRKYRCLVWLGREQGSKYKSSVAEKKQDSKYVSSVIQEKTG